MYLTDILFVFSSAALIYSALSPKLSQFVVNVFLSGFLLLFLLSDQYDFIGNPISAEIQGHLLEVTECKSNLGFFTIVEPLKSLSVFLACNFNIPWFFDFFYKFVFTLSSIFLNKLSFKIHANPLIPICLLVFPVMYGNSRSSLAALFICISFICYLLNLNNNQLGIRHFLKHSFSSSLSLPIIAHSSAFIVYPFIFAFNLLVSCIPFFKLKYLLQIKLKYLLSTLIFISIALFLLSFLKSQAYFLGKPVLLYFGSINDVTTFFGLPIKHLITLIIPFSIVYLCFFKVKRMSTYFHNIYLVALLLCSLLIIIFTSLSFSTEVASRFSFLLLPSFYLFLSTYFHAHPIYTSTNNSKFFRFLFYSFLFLILFSYTSYEYGLSPHRSFFLFPPVQLMTQ